MEENRNAKRRDRIKTILIIFLTILLLLTFFSNTILNHSLPTVSAQYAGYGQITEKVRGSGIVTANQKYDVVAEGNRKVTSVSVKAGDEIKAGDKLFVLDSADNAEEIKSLEDGIREAELAYQKALLTTAPTYAKENQEIADARADLQNAINKLNDAKRQSGSAISAAAYQQATKQAADAGEQIATLKGYIALAESGELDGIPSQYTAAQSAAKAALDKANADLEAATAALTAKQAEVTVSSAEQKTNVTTLERASETANTTAARAEADYEASAGDLELKRAMEDAQAAARYAAEDVEAAKTVLAEIEAKEQAVRDAQAAVSAAEAAAAAARTAVNQALGAVTGAIQQDINAAQRSLDSANATISAYDAQGETADIATLEEAVTTSQRTLQGLILALSETQKEDDLTAKGAALDLQSQQLAIDKQKEALEKLRKDSGSVTITAKNGGVVESVNCSAGDTAADGTVLASITLTDSGYTVEFTATAEQARKVKIGTLADITNNYSYSDITAKLISAKADTSNPASQDRILTFDISGKDITPGQMLSLSINCSTQNYDCVVPSSAIGVDNDSKYVLVMQPRSTPLGNRYYAVRVNVTVLASDEINSAVQGEVSPSDFVIVTAEKPIKAGDQVRMEDK